MAYFLVLLAALLFNSPADAQTCRGTMQRDQNGADFCDAATVRTNIGAGQGTVTSVTAGEGLSTAAGTFGGSVTSTGTISPSLQINAQTGTTYTVLNSDCNKLVTFNNASVVAVTLPQAGAASSFLTGCSITYMNIGAGNVTITPTTSTIDGLSSRVLQRYGGVKLTSNGTNYISAGVAPAVGADGIIDADQLPTAVGGGTPKKGAVVPGTCLEMGGSGNTVISLTTACRTVAIPFIIDGGGSAITTGIKGDLEIPFGCTITAVRTLLDQSGSIVVDIWKDTYANFPPTVADTITASAKPTVSSATKAEDSTLTGWTTSVAAGNILRFNVDSITTATRATISLTCVKS